MEGDFVGDSKGFFRGDFKQDMEGDLLSSSGQVRSMSGSGYSSNLIPLSLTLKTCDLLCSKIGMEFLH